MFYLILRLIFINFIFFSINAFAATSPSIYTEETKNILATAGQPQFIIQLKSNPTTGYSWFLRSYDANIIIPLDHHYQAPKKNLMGASGIEVWTFKIKPRAFTIPQQTSLHFIYARPWENNTEASTELIFHISTQVKR